MSSMNGMNKKFTIMVMTIVACVVLLCGSAFAEERRDSVTVTGVASVEVAPDMAVINGNLETRAKTADEARELMAQKMRDLKFALIQAGVAQEDIQTTNYNLRPDYTYEKNRQILNGYVVFSGYNVKAEGLDTLPKVLDTAVKKDMMINNVRYGLMNRAAIENGLLEQAVKNARTQAAVVARSGGRTLGNLIHADLGRVESGESATPRNMLMAKGASADALETPTQLSAGTIKVSTSVNLEFAMY